MNFQHSELRERLAGEYVLGTLQGQARKRFETWLQQDPQLRDYVADWQSRMMWYVNNLTPIVPPKSVWSGISRRLSFQRTPLWGEYFWRNVGLMASFATVVLTLYIVMVLPPAIGPAYMAVIADSHAKPQWLISQHQHTLSIKSLTPISLAANRSMELWLLPENGKPVSLGLLPTSGIKTAQLAEKLTHLFARTHVVAVSIEPAGGSPTGQPTGPVVYQAALVLAG